MLLGRESLEKMCVVKDENYTVKEFSEAFAFPGSQVDDRRVGSIKVPSLKQVPESQE